MYLFYDSLCVKNQDHYIGQQFHWLKVLFQIVRGPLEAGDCIVYECHFKDQIIRVLVTEMIENGLYTSIWFNGDILPWSSLSELSKIAEKYS